MNPLTNVRNIQKLNETELKLGTVGKKSWHDQYKDSAWIFVGGLPYDLTEGDILCVFSQYGEIVNINLVRDKGTGKSKGYGFICFEDQRSTVLSVDNLNSIKLLGRVIRVDHVENYKVPKQHDDVDEITKRVQEEGCAPKLPSSSSEDEEEETELVIPKKKVKKEKDPDKKSKKKKKKEKRKKRDESSGSESEEERSHDRNQPMKIKKEKYDPGYEQSFVGKQERQFKSEREENGSRGRNREQFDERQRSGGDRNSGRFGREHGERNFSRDRDSEYRNGVRSQDRRDERWREGRRDRDQRGDYSERDRYSRGDNSDGRRDSDRERKGNRDDNRDYRRR